jgi:hypothetical protein
MKLDPKLLLPQSVINFFMRQMAGIFLYVMQTQAKKVTSRFYDGIIVLEVYFWS